MKHNILILQCGLIYKLNWSYMQGWREWALDLKLG